MKNVSELEADVAALLAEKEIREKLDVGSRSIEFTSPGARSDFLNIVKSRVEDGDDLDVRLRDELALRPYYVKFHAEAGPKAAPEDTNGPRIEDIGPNQTQAQLDAALDAIVRALPNQHAGASIEEDGGKPFDTSEIKAGMDEQTTRRAFRAIAKAMPQPRPASKP